MKKRKYTTVYRALARRLVIPVMALWLLSMGLLTWAVGKAFYHPYGARFSYNVRILKLKDAKEADEGACLFICNQLMEMAKNYNYGRLLGTERLGKESIYLPEKDGKPDFEYMSKYIANIMIEKYEKYLSWSEEKNRE